MYSREHVYLYKTVDTYGNFDTFYEVEDGSGRSSGRFLILQDSTTVTKPAFIAISASKIVTILPLDGKPFEFYRDLFGLDDFSVSITNTHSGDTYLKKCLWPGEALGLPRPSK